MSGKALSEQRARLLMNDQTGNGSIICHDID